MEISFAQREWLRMPKADGSILIWFRVSMNFERENRITPEDYVSLVATSRKKRSKNCFY